MIFKTSIDKLSRGCGEGNWCGKYEPPNGLLLCRECKAQLTLLQNLSKQVQEVLDKEWNNAFMSSKDYMENVKREMNKL